MHDFTNSYMKEDEVKSEFELSMTLGVIGITIVLLALLSWVTFVWLTNMEEIGLFQRIMITFFPLLVTPLIFRIELPKIKKLTINNQGLTIKNPMTGLTKNLRWNDIDGYQTIVHITRGGLLKELMIVSDNKVIHEVSENYIKNYPEVKRALTKHLKNLGPVDFNYFKYIKERLLKK